MLKKLKQEVVNAGLRFGAAAHDAWFKAGLDADRLGAQLAVAYEYIDNILWFMMGAHIGLLLLSGQQWCGPIIVGYAMGHVITGIGVGLIFS